MGLGLHQVYAAGFSTVNNTKLTYIDRGETSEQFVNRFFNDTILNDDLNGYTIYVHNLGRFDAMFIINSLVLNKDVTITPI